MTNETRLEAGDVAPDFTLLDHTGAEVTLSEMRGKWVVFWWYVRASTPG